MTVSPLYLVRRCDGFYRYWHDVTDPAPLSDAYASYHQLTGGGVHSTCPDHAEYYDIFPAGGFSGWQDGSLPLVRRLHRRDAPAVEAHLKSLGPSGRRLRFFREASDGQIVDYVKRLSWSRSVLVGAILDDRLIGLAEAVFDREELPRRAEIAVSVERAYRRRGLGRHLVSQVVDHAELLGAPQPHLVFLQENGPLRQIVHALGGLIEPQREAGSDELVGVLGALPAFDTHLAMM